MQIGNLSLNIYIIYSSAWLTGYNIQIMFNERDEVDLLPLINVFFLIFSITECVSWVQITAVDFPLLHHKVSFRNARCSHQTSV